MHCSAAVDFHPASAGGARVRRRTTVCEVSAEQLQVRHLAPGRCGITCADADDRDAGGTRSYYWTASRSRFRNAPWWSWRSPVSRSVCMNTPSCLSAGRQHSTHVPHAVSTHCTPHSARLACIRPTVSVVQFGTIGAPHSAGGRIAPADRRKCDAQVRRAPAGAARDLVVPAIQRSGAAPPSEPSRALLKRRRRWHVAAHPALWGALYSIDCAGGAAPRCGRALGCRCGSGRPSG